jgi:hypothetical protein
MAELESQGELTRSEVATFLREFANEIDDGLVDRRSDREEIGEELTDENSLDTKRITLIVGGDSATVTLPETMEFDVEIESRSPMLASGAHQGIEFELSWEIENPDELEGDWIEVE